MDPQPSRFERLVQTVPDRRVVISRSTGQAWAAIETNGRFNFLPLFSPQLRELLLERFPARSLPSPALVRQALRFLQDHARVEDGLSPTLRVNSGSHPVPYVALDASEGRLFYPRTIEIRPGEWSFTKESWASFYRPRHNASLPDPSKVPAHERSLEPLRQLLHLASPADFTRILVWLLAALRPKGPYPILVLQGPSGSGKSQAAKILRSIIDPSAVPFLPLPTSETRLWQLAFDHYILAFDHLSAMPRRLSDMLARLSSGASCFWHDTPCHLQRPILLTVPGHANWTPAPDLASRILVAHFSDLSPDQRLPESEMESKFRAAHAPVLAALCDAVSQALTRDPQASGTVDSWAKAAAPALHLTDEEISAALCNAAQFTRHPDPLIAPLRDILIATPGHEWTGSSTELLAALPPSVRPSCPEELSKRLKKIEESLSFEGIELTFIRTNQHRSIRLRGATTLGGVPSGSVPTHRDALPSHAPEPVPPSPCDPVTPAPPPAENAPSPCHPVTPAPPPIENAPSPCDPVTPAPPPIENAPSPCPPATSAPPPIETPCHPVTHRPACAPPSRARQPAVFRPRTPSRPVLPLRTASPLVFSIVVNDIPVRFRLAALAVLVPLILGAQNLKEFEKKVTEFTLPNGLHFIVVERHEAPTVSFFTRVNAGSVNDPAGRTGLAHMLERMAFKGTESIGSVDWPSEKKALDNVEEVYDRIDAGRNRDPLESRGQTGGIDAQLTMAIDEAQAFAASSQYLGIIETNGGTGVTAAASADATEYSCSLPSNRIELWFLMESQRLLNPVFREFYKERSALVEESRARLETNPQGRLLQELLSIAFEAHPYRNPSLGWPSDIAALRATEARRFFQEYYVAANIAIAVAGDVNPAEARRLAERYFGPMPARPLPPAVQTTEPPQPGPKTVVLNGAAQSAAVIGYKRPDQYDPDNPVYDLLQLLLSEGRTSLLYKNLVEGKRITLAAQAIAAYPAARYPGLFAFLLLPSPGHTVEENQKALDDLLARLQQEGVAEAALARARTQAHAAIVRRLATNAGLAAVFTTYYANFGDWRKLFTWLDGIDKVTPPDVQRTSQRCFVPGNRTLAFAPAGQPRGDKQ